MGNKRNTKSFKIQEVISFFQWIRPLKTQKMVQLSVIIYKEEANGENIQF